MKKIIAVALTLLMVFALTACGGGNTNTPAESAGSESQQASSGSEASSEQGTPAGSEQTDPSGEASVLDLCGLTVDEIQTTVGTSLGEAIETPTQYVVPVFCADASFESFEGWVNALADNCRSAAKDGNIYEDEFSTEPQDSFELDTEALINMVQFVYKTAGHTVYVTAADAGSVENAFSCNIQVY